jgi:FKBP-type peptidyl-prolyl cis-trans isomerase FkpA
MTKHIAILVILAFTVLQTGCKKDEDIKEQDDKIIREYLETNSLVAQKTASGLYYIIEVPGVFPKPSDNSIVTVHYKGYLTNKSVFDSTEGGNPATFQLSGVIDGWQEGLQYYGEGGKGILLIPSHLGYGSSIMPGIPSNSVLIFDIHLIDVE